MMQMFILTGRFSGDMAPMQWCYFQWHRCRRQLMSLVLPSLSWQENVRPGDVWGNIVVNNLYENTWPCAAKEGTSWFKKI
jgi:hypothetical protein